MQEIQNTPKFLNYSLTIDIHRNTRYSFEKTVKSHQFEVCICKKSTKVIGKRKTALYAVCDVFKITQSLINTIYRVLN